MFNFTIFGVIALVALVTDINGQLGGGAGPGFGAAAMGPSAFGMFAPPAASGWMMGQEASKNAVNFAVNSAIAKVDASVLPPELQVCHNSHLIYSKIPPNVEIIFSVNKIHINCSS